MILDFSLDGIRSPCRAYDAAGAEIGRGHHIWYIDTITGVCKSYLKTADGDGFVEHDGEMESYVLTFSPPLKVVDAEGYVYQ